MAVLEIISGKSEGQLHELQGSLLIGMGDEATLRLTDNGVSRKHARIEASGGGFQVTDLGSSNGTYVNFKRLDKEGTAPLNDRDVLFVGRTVVKFYAEAPESRGGASQEELRDLLRGAVPIAALASLKKPGLVEAARRIALNAERAEVMRRLGMHMMGKGELDALLQKARS